MCVFSAANEVGVAECLAGDIRFTDIDKVIAGTLQGIDLAEPESLDAVQALDQAARDVADKQIAGWFTRPEA